MAGAGEELARGRIVSAGVKTTKACGDCGQPFEGGAFAQWGPCCRWKYRGRRRLKYVWTPERDQALRDRYHPREPGAIDALARDLGWPTWAIKKRATQLGLTQPFPRKNWTHEEVEFLWQHAGTRTTHWIAKKLARGEGSVVLKLKCMKISARVHDGYTMGDLCTCFGVDHRVIERWVKLEMLDARRRGTEREHDTWSFGEQAVLRFIAQHPMEFRLDKVDQLWFMDLIVGGGLLRAETPRKAAGS